MNYHKQCRKCNELKTLEDFHKDRNSADGLASRCKKCVRAAGISYRERFPDKRKETLRNWQKANPEKANAIASDWKKRNKEKTAAASAKYQRYFYKEIRGRYIQKTYGITWKEYDSIMAIQKGNCAICELPFEKKRLAHIDHCHKSNTVRGLLCSKCNMGLGLFNENLKLLVAAYRYLRSPIHVGC